MIDQLTRTSVEEILTLEQHEVDARASDMFEMMGINATLAYIDLQEDVVEQLQARRDELLQGFLERPTEAFVNEFNLLKRLYEGRTMTYDYGHSRSDEFVTRDADRVKADLHFREVSFDSGVVKQTVEVPRGEDASESFFITVQDGELGMQRTSFNGYTRIIDVEVGSELGMRLLAEFFTHSNKASGLMFDRPADELTQADIQAKAFLREKIQSRRTL